MRGLALAAIGVSAGIVLIVLAIRAFGSEFPAIASHASVRNARGRGGVDVCDCAGRLVAAGGSRGSDRARGSAAR